MAVELSQELRIALFQKYGKEYKTGAILFHQGEIAEVMYIIIDGNVDIYKEPDNDQEKEQYLATLGTGDFLGEMSILNNEPRSASAKISNDAKILVIDQATFKAMIQHNAGFAMKILARLSDRIREGNVVREGMTIEIKKIHMLKKLVKLSENTTSLSELKAKLLETKEFTQNYIDKFIENYINMGFIKSNGDNFQLVGQETMQNLTQLL